jgi:hypothetical protein
MVLELQKGQSLLERKRKSIKYFGDKNLKILFFLKMNEVIEEAQELARRIKLSSREYLEPLQVCSLLEVLAQEEDKKSFRIIVNAYVNQIRIENIRKDSADKCEIIRGDIDNDSYAYVEWLCMLADNNDVIGFSKRKRFRINPKNPPEIRKTQKFFQKLYGSRFYQVCAVLDDVPGVFKIEDYK